MTTLADYAASLQMRDLIQTMVETAINQQRPKYQYAQVKNIDPENYQCGVVFVGDPATNVITVKMGSIQPVQVGQVVRVGGKAPDKFVEDVMGPVDLAGHPGLYLPKLVTDLNDAIEPGTYWMTAGTNGPPRGTTWNVDVRADARFPVTTRETDLLQVAYRLLDSDVPEIWMRQRNDAGSLSTWGTWHLVAGPPLRYAIGTTGNPAFKNSWTNYGSGYQGAAYWMDSNYVVHLEGLIKGGTISTGTTGVAFTLPAGFLPLNTRLIGTYFSTNAIGRIQLANTGDISIYSTETGGSNGYVTLEGITFPTK